MKITRFQKIGVLLSVLVLGGLFLSSGISFADDVTPPTTPVILSPLAHRVEEGRVTFSWFSFEEESGIAGYSYLLDSYSNTVVDDVVEGAAAHTVYELSKGQYYFHIAAVDNAGNWSTGTTHFALKVLEGTVLVDDFDDGAAPNSLGHAMGTFDCGDGSFCISNHTDDAGITMGGTGYSLQLDYVVLTADAATSFAGYWTGFNDMNLSGYQSLSLWVKGAEGGEFFNIGFKDLLLNESKVNINDYLAGGVTTSWQRVIIPLHAFHLIVNWSHMDSLTIVFQGEANLVPKTVYIDNIELLAGYVLADNFDAARPQNQPPYWSFSDGGATIDAGYTSTGAYGGSGNSLEITYDVVTPTAYCGWMVNFGGIDISRLNMLGFYAKGASFGGENFNVYLSDGVHREFVEVRHYLALRDEWHYVKIPLEDFGNKGVDLSSVNSLEIVFEWEAMSGTIYIDNIEFTNGLFKEPSIGPVKISGGNLLMYGKPFRIKGVCYQPTPINKKPYSTVAPPGDPYSDPDFHDSYYDYPDDPVKAEYNRQMWARDLQLLRAMNCNTIRTYAKVTSTAFLDACYDDGIDPIYVIMGIWVDHHEDFRLPEKRITAIDEFAQYVETFKDPAGKMHPAILMWAIGNEDNYSYPHHMSEFYSLVNEMARTAYEIEGPTYHPVMFPNGDLHNMGDDTMRATDSAMNYMDLWGSNAYWGLTFADFFADYRTKSNKPVVITEYGIDAWDHIGLTEHENEQAYYAVSAWDEFIRNSDICVGGTIMAYSDEWWKDSDGVGPDLPDFGGYPLDTHPDGYANEEWWGVMRIVDDRPNIDILQPRQVYYDLKEKWTTELLIDDFNDGEDPNELGGEMDAFESDGSLAARVYVDDVNEVLGGVGYSMQLTWALVGANAYGGFYTLFSPDATGVDARGYDVLTFWVKGAAGGEIFKVALRDGDFAHETKVAITDYLPEGTTAEWQQVVIPLAAFKDVVEWDALECFAIIAEEWIGSGMATIYIDEIRLENRATSLFVDNFNDNIPQNALQCTSWTYNDPGATISAAYDVSNPYGGTGKSYYIMYSTTTTDACAWVTGLSYYVYPRGVVATDVSSKDTLSFYIRGALGGEEPNVYLNDGFNKKGVDIENYVTVTTDWQRVNIPLYDFSSQGVDLTHLLELSFIFEWEAMTGTIYIDDIAFINYSALITPTLNEVPAIANTSPITLSGTKAPGTGIFINGEEVAAIDDDTIWSYDFPLVSGENIIKLTARDSQNNESEEIIVSVTLDPSVALTIPPAANLVIVNDPDGLGRDDATINVTVNNYPVETVRHTGYTVEVSDSATFTWPDYAVYTYWHNSVKPANAEFIDEDVNFDVDLSLFVGTDVDDVWTTLPATGYVRVKAARYGYAPSEFDGLTQIALLDTLLLETPDNAILLNEGEDPIVQVAIYPLIPAQRTTGVIETGYRIDFLPGNRSFATADWGDMYHLYENYDKDGDEIPDEVDVDLLKFNIDFSDVVESGIFSWSVLSTHGVKAQVSSIRKGFTPSEPVDAGSVAVKDITRLQNPTSDLIDVVNYEDDRTITVIVEDYDPINLGVSVPTYIQHKKDMHHTGYRIDVCRDDAFKPEETFRFDYTYDFGGDGVPNEIKSSAPGDDIKIDIDLDLARNVLGSAFIDAGGTVYVRVIAIREGFAINYEDIPGIPFTVSFQDMTRLENPDTYAQVYNSEPGSPPAKMDRTITVEVGNYDPSGVASGNNLKDSNHTGYQIDICKDQVFNADETFHYYYIYDPDEDGIPDEINSSIPEAIKAHIDLDLARDVLGADHFSPTVEHTVYIRVIAIRQGYAVNYEDIPSTPLSVDFLDRTLLTEPPSAVVWNIKNINAGNDIDSSVFTYITLTDITPGDVIHDEYRCKFDIVCADGNTYSKIARIADLVPDINGDIPEVRDTIDIKDLFENDSNPYNRLSLEDFIGIPAEALASDHIESMAVTIASTKAGYTDSIPIAPTLPVALDFRNTSNSFFPVVTDINVSNPGGAAIVRVELGTYPFTGIPATAPPQPARYEIQCSSDPTFPLDDDGDVTITSYEDTSETNPLILNIDIIAGLLGTAAYNTIYVRVRFLKDGYTPGVFTDLFSIAVADITVQSGESIQDAVIRALDGEVIFAFGGAPYEGDITVEGKGVKIIGESVHTTTISGNITLKDSDSVIEDLTIAYDSGEEITYTNGYYSLFKLLTDAGITAINSDITVKDCIIMPDSGYSNYGKAIQIWNLYGNGDISPIIENSLILDAETGIYLFSQAFGGAITGEIKNNTLDLNTYGIVMRMHQENPLIQSNIITRSEDAIHLTYDSLLTERLANIVNNDICYDIVEPLFNNTYRVWCDTQGTEVTPTGLDNIEEYPDFNYSYPDLDYIPQNENCSDKGCRLP